MSFELALPDRAPLDRVPLDRVPLDRALLGRVRGRLAGSPGAPTLGEVAAAVRREAGVCGDAEVLAAAESLRAELVGAGQLEPLLREPGVTDVLVNGCDDVWVDRGAGLERAGVRFADNAAVRRLAVRLAGAAGRRLDDASPYVDVRLPDGVRLHAVLPPIAPGGPHLSLRVPRRRAFELHELVAAGTLVPAAAALLEAIVTARLSFLVTGGTGSGKTTVLASLLGLVAPGERLVLVEDCGELRPSHSHVVRLEARPANAEGAGAIDLRALVRQALRMRPDRLVVGEVRGAECVDMLAAFNVGHDGGACTLHANSVADVPARIEGLCVAAGLTREATHSQLAAGLQCVVHLAGGRDGRRRLDAVGVLRRGARGMVGVEPAWRQVGAALVAESGRAALDVLLSRSGSGWPGSGRRP